MTDQPSRVRSEPQPYLEQLESLLADIRDTDFYEELRYSHTDIQRFEPYLSRLSPYASLNGSAVLDMGAGTSGLLLACQQRGASGGA